MKKFINSINNPKSDSIHSVCLLATMLCAVQAVTHIARLVILVYQFLTTERTETVSYLDLLDGKTVLQPSVLQLIVQFLMAAVPVCLCVLSFRGMSRPVQKRELAVAGACLLALAAAMLIALPSAVVAGGAAVLFAVVAALAAAAGGVLIILDRFQNVYPAALLAVFFVIVLALGSKVIVSALDAAAAFFGAAAVLMASKDPKMA